ncbi:hypothetical protein [Nocardioides daphniae]|uniref:DUF485 domain-containing protein n=1 Tax=Nocardioides daphniae TaxID=402297 RepID=A0A4P7UE13_9ACTN|nr:hypothetical protein [Nocardioides daphniae]QCC78356.1 hypothetical protein E2C04_16215 [Nocardioides daphniae]GGD13269.1 hypothetical protein GCM10007231_10360 [Nocardioides daphniae]
MSSTPPERVRVTGPPRRASHTRRPGAGDIDEGTRIGAILVGSLVGEQRRLAVRVLSVLAVTLGSLPLVFRLLPALADVRLLGIPLAYLLLWVLVHPLLIGLGWFYVRRAEANERAFAALVEHDRPDDDDRQALR